MAKLKPRLVTAVPLVRRGDGPQLCRRFCRLYERIAGQARIPAHLRLKDGPYFCVRSCGGYAAQKPIKIHRPRSRGRTIARHLAQLHLVKEAAK